MVGLVSTDTNKRVYSSESCFENLPSPLPVLNPSFLVLENNRADGKPETLQTK